MTLQSIMCSSLFTILRHYIDAPLYTINNQFRLFVDDLDDRVKKQLKFYEIYITLHSEVDQGVLRDLETPI